ncbi:MAG TPA: amidohydrolase [Pirellulaceae bacterium]|nr:amidohydrolase [Pirellulaceae bacterium]HMP68785.1 amidohydrolase [Pirellulaceae bacterium]
MLTISRKFILWATLLSGFFCSRSAFTQNFADLYFHNGSIVTVDDAVPHVEAVAVAEGKILAVGSHGELQHLIGESTRVVDLQGRLLIPGFIEGHGHFMGLGQSRMMLDLTSAESWEEIEEMVIEAAKTTERGKWIIGRGWHQSKWTSPPANHVGGYPTSKRLDETVPDHPVMLTHASGHMNFANAYAMQLAGVTDDTANPNGGEILRDESGKATGAFRSTAQTFITGAFARDERRITPEERGKLDARAIQLAVEESLRKGVTSFHDAGSTFAMVRALKDAADRGDLKVRLYVMIRESNDMLSAQLSRYKMIDYANQFLTVRALKVSIDGALGPHGAWLLAPYEDLPSSVGLNTVSLEATRRTAEIAIENDFQLCIHAIGDRANREVLNIYEETFARFPTKDGRRWRIEHAQHLHPDDIPRYGKLGVIASMQGIHCTSDAIFVLQRLGVRRAAEGAYVWQKLMNSGAVVTNGTDAPVEDLNPIPSFYASVTRRLKDGSQFFPEECMTREQALRSYTLACAYSAFEEEAKGSITPGKLADLVVLSTNIMVCDAEEILDAKVDMTIVGGDVLYERIE